MIRTIVFVLLAFFTFNTYTQAAENVAGTVKSMRGSALAVQNAQVRPLKIGDEILIGDILSTGPDSRLEITMIDEASFKLGATTSFVVTDYSFGQGENSAVLDLLTGAMDGVSGQIAKVSSDGMQITTPVATIGIRGTKFFVGEMDGEMNVAHWSGGGVSVKNFAGEVFLAGNNEGTQLVNDKTAPTTPKAWGAEKKKRAKALVD